MRIAADRLARHTRSSNLRPRLSAVSRLVLVAAAVAGGWATIAPAAPLVVIPPVKKPATRPVGAVAAAGAATPAPATVAKPIAWMTNFTAAFTFAQKQDRMILAYFSSSDADEWGQKWEKEVMKTDLFHNWVDANVIPVQIDFPKEKKISTTIKAQNEKLMAEYNVRKVPTFLFIDSSGEVLARCGYDTLKLRDEEPKEQPKKAIEYLDSVVKARPAKESLIAQRSLKDAVKVSRSKALPLLLLVTQNPGEYQLREKDALLTNQQFVRFVNKNLVFCVVEWPLDADVSPDAVYVREFAAKWQFGPSPLQLVLWDPGGLGRLKDRISAVSGNPQLVGPLVKRLDAALPNIDYNGGVWVEDFKVARAIAHQQKKDILMAFISSDGSEWSKKMDDEIFATPEFKKYAKDGLVLVKVDYPKASANATPTAGPKGPYEGKAALTTTAPSAPTTQRSPEAAKEEMVTAKDGTQPAALKEQNRMLAEMFNIRGYPTVIVLNPLGQKIIDAKYMKGGPTVFISEMDKARKKDRDRRTLISEQEAAK